MDHIAKMIAEAMAKCVFPKRGRPEPQAPRAKCAILCAVVARSSGKRSFQQ